MTTDMLIVFSLLGMAILVFVFDLLRVDIVGILIMVLLALTGVLTADEAIAGLSSNAVVSIIAVMIIGAGLNRTGIMNVLAGKIIKVAGRSEKRIMVVVSTTVAIISSFMQNIGAAALFLPATTRISQQLGIPVSRILMPMGFAAITGGCLTLVGSSPLIMLNDLMASWWQNNSATVSGSFEPLSLFSVTPVGVALLLGVLLYFVIAGRFVLPAGSEKASKGGLATERVRDLYQSSLNCGVEFEIPHDFQAMTLEELKLRPRFQSTVIGIARKDGEVDVSPSKDSVIGPGDIVAMVSTHDRARQIAERLGWVASEEKKTFSSIFTPADYGIVQGIIPPGSLLVGHNMAELDFRDRYRLNALAIYRGDNIILDDINMLELKAGDTLLLLGPWEKFRSIRKSLDLVFIEELKGEETAPEKAVPALICLGVALSLALVFNVQLSIALMTGAIGMVLSRVISIDNAYASVDWMTIFLLAGLIPLGTAFEKTGAAAFLATGITSSAGELSPFVLMLVTALLTSFFSLVASNVGATVLMVPLAMNMALQSGINPVIAAVTVGIAASNTFILPTHQVNALIMRPGNYRTLDYIKAGTGVTVIYLIIMIGMIYLLF